MSFLYNILPEYTRNSDTTTDYNVTGEVKVLEEFLNCVDVEIFDVISDSIREILTFTDIYNIKNEYLPYFAYILGYKWNTRLPVDLQRDILINILDVYKRKGTKFSFHFGLYRLDPTVNIYEPYRNIFTLNKSHLNGGFDIYTRWRYKLNNTKKIVIDSSYNVYAINDNELYKIDKDGNKIFNISFNNYKIEDINIKLIAVGKDIIYIQARDIINNISYFYSLDVKGNIKYEKNWFNIKCFDLDSNNNIYLAINEDTVNDSIIKINDITGELININGEVSYNIDNLNKINIKSITCNNNFMYVNIIAEETPLIKSNTILKIYNCNNENNTINELHEYIYSYDLSDNITAIKYDNSNNIYIVINNRELIKFDSEYYNNITLRNDIPINSFDVCRFKSRNYMIIGTNNNVIISDITGINVLYSFKTVNNVNYIKGLLTKNAIYYINDDIIVKNYYNMINGDCLTSRDYYSNGIIVVQTKNMSNEVKEIIKLVIPAGWKLLIEGTTGLYYSFHDKTATDKDDYDLFNFLDEYRKKYIDYYIYSDILSDFENTQTDENKIQYYSGIQYHNKGHMNIVMLGKTFIIDTNDSLYRMSDINLFAESEYNNYTGFRNPLQYVQVTGNVIYETNDSIKDGLYMNLAIPNKTVAVEILIVGAGGGSSDLINLSQNTYDNYNISVGGGAGEVVKTTYYIDQESLDLDLDYNYVLIGQAGVGGIINNNGENSIVRIVHSITYDELFRETALGGKAPIDFDPTSIKFNGGLDYNNTYHGAEIYSLPNNWINTDKLISVYNSFNNDSGNIIHLTNTLENGVTTHNYCTAGSSSYDIGLGYKYSNNSIGSGGCFAIPTIDENLDYVYGKGGNGYIRVTLYFKVD